MAVNGRGRPTKQQKAARAELDRLAAIRNARLTEQFNREIEIATDLAELDGFDDAVALYWGEVYWMPDMVAARQRIYAV